MGVDALLYAAARDQSSYTGHLPDTGIETVKPAPVHGTSDALTQNGDTRQQGIYAVYQDVSGVSKSSTGLAGWGKAGHVHLCRVAGNTV